VRGFRSNEGVKKDTLLKRRYFADIGSSSKKTVADRYRHMLLIITNTGDDGLFRFINIDDLA